jgi:hypothetical protein
MSKLSIVLEKEIPLKIYRNISQSNKNLNLNIIPNIEPKRKLRLSFFSSKDNGIKLSKSINKINEQKYLTENKIPKLTYKELCHLNSSSDITKNNTQNNSYKNQTKNNSKKNIILITSKSNSNYSKSVNNTEGNIIKKEINEVNNHNLINFNDRKKIKKLVSGKVLNLYDLYVKRKSQKLQMDELLPSNRSFINENIETDKNYLFKNYNNNNNSSKNSFYNYSNLKTPKRNRKLNKNRRTYTLSQLMKLNPYRLVSGKVRYSDFIDLKDISEKLNELNSDRIKIKHSNKPTFFKNSNIKDSKLGKMVNNFYVQFNYKVSYEYDSVWRILSRIKKVEGYNPFYISCLFKGYYELWRGYSVLLEQLLVKYPIFKWFLDKNKYMKEEAFREFIECIKLGMKNDKDFPKKILFLFGEDNLIDIKKFLFIMKLTSNSDDIPEKINFFEILLTNSNQQGQENSINVMEFFLMFKQIFNSSTYKKDIRYFINILKKEFNNNKKFDYNLYISRKQMSDLLINDPFFSKKIREFQYKYKNADKNYEEQISFHFNSNARILNHFIFDEK